MKLTIKTRLSVQFTILVIGILVFFSLLLYYFAFSSQQNKFRENLGNRAKNTAILLITIREVDSTLLKLIHRSTVSWKREEIVVCDTSFELFYSNNPEYLDTKVMSRHVPLEGKAYFTLHEKDAVSYRYIDEGKVYYVYVAAFDAFRRTYLAELKEILFWSVIFSIWLSVLFSYLFSRRAIRPVAAITNRVKEINASRLSLRLEEGNRKDELDTLAMTFNEMLANLENSFKSQQEFIANASHELRTPLSVLMAESEYFISRDREKEEYKNHIRSHLEDFKRLNSTLNSLLELAQFNRDVDIPIGAVRLDEVILTAIQSVKSKYIERRVIPDFSYPENEEELVVEGNFGLLMIAFRNIIENACKFSEGEVTIRLISSDDLIRISVADEGIGIPEDEIDAIIKPFSRGSNARFKSGYGIGLALFSKIMNFHRADWKIDRREQGGTIIKISIKKKRRDS